MWPGGGGGGGNGGDDGGGGSGGDSGCGSSNGGVMVGMLRLITMLNSVWLNSTRQFPYTIKNALELELFRPKESFHLWPQ